MFVIWQDFMIDAGVFGNLLLKKMADVTQSAWQDSHGTWQKTGGFSFDIS